MFARYGVSFAFVLAVAVASPQPVAHAARTYDWPVDPMCNHASVIVEGVHESGNTVRIEKIYKGESLLGKPAATIDVLDLQKHSKARWEDGYPEPKDTIKTVRLVAFLEYSKENQAWASISTRDDRGACGSCGVFWFDEATCYSYRQLSNPGPLRLFAAKDAEWRTPKTVADLRAAITQGLENSTEWRRSVSLEDPEQQAKAIARYLLKSTSPNGDKGSYRFHVREPMRKLGKQAVPALIEVLRMAPEGESLGPAVLILYDIGPPAAAAVPVLREILASPDCDCTEYILSALGSIGDERALPDLEKYRDGADPALADAAKKAIAKLHEQHAAWPKQ
jgi:hypothetical protein